MRGAFDSGFDLVAIHGFPWEIKQVNVTAIGAVKQGGELKKRGVNGLC